MGFSGGGSNVTKAHTHDSTVIQDGGSLAANATQFGLTNGSLLFSDGSNIQELGVGVTAQILGVSGGTPAWVSSVAASTLTKVTKDYTDVAGGSLTIYSLPADEALVNIFTDITTVWDGSTTAVMVGDAADDNGFSETADWQSLGLTDATRGAYISGFKGMRSTSGTTDIVASGGEITTQAGSTADNERSTIYVYYKQITGLRHGRLSYSTKQA